MVSPFEMAVEYPKLPNSLFALAIAKESVLCSKFSLALLKLAVDWLFTLGNESVKLSTEVNTRAEAFYLAQGWQRGEVDEFNEVSFKLYKS